MIFEYALEPELVANWGNPSDGRFFSDKFGVGTGRLVSRYPKKWVRRVWDAQTSSDALARKRLEVLLQKLTAVMVQRKNALWDANKSWFENSLAEHKRVPFRAILARANSEDNHCVVDRSDLQESVPKLLEVNLGLTVARNAVVMASAVQPFLRVSRTAIFIDPYFREYPRFLAPLEAFFRTLFSKRRDSQPERIEIHAAKYHGAPELPFFKDRCERAICPLLPRGVTLKIVRWTSRTGSDNLHDRFILTELGGVIFSVGLDEGAPGETVRLNLMSRDQYIHAWEQYAGPRPAFDFAEEPFEIQGTKQLSSID